MTSATEKLRRMLDERGVEYTTDDGKFAKVTKWLALSGRLAVFAEYDSGELRFAMDSLSLTPEQAIAATLGGGECEFKPFADEDLSEPNAVRGVCSACSALMHGGDNYCANCGRKVSDERCI